MHWPPNPNANDSFGGELAEALRSAFSELGQRFKKATGGPHFTLKAAEYLRFVGPLVYMTYFGWKYYFKEPDPIEDETKTQVKEIYRLRLCRRSFFRFLHEFLIDFNCF